MPRETEGTHRLHREHALGAAVAAGRAKAHALSRDADLDAPRRAKIAVAKRGKPRPEHVVAALANRGRPLSAEHRRKLSAAHRRRGTRPPKAGRPWTVDEDELVRTLPAPETVARTGRPLSSVYGRRRQLKVPDGRKQQQER